MSFKNFFGAKYCFFWLLQSLSFFFSKRKVDSEIEKSMRLSQAINWKARTKKITKLEAYFRIVMIVRKAVKILKDRTKYRPLKSFYDKEKELLDDPSFFKSKSKRNEFFFIRNKVFRVFKKKMKGLYRRYLIKTLKTSSKNKIFK